MIMNTRNGRKSLRARGRNSALGLESLQWQPTPDFLADGEKRARCHFHPKESYPLSARWATPPLEKILAMERVRVLFIHCWNHWPPSQYSKITVILILYYYNFFSVHIHLHISVTLWMTEETFTFTVHTNVTDNEIACWHQHISGLGFQALECDQKSEYRSLGPTLSELHGPVQPIKIRW